MNFKQYLTIAILFVIAIGIYVYGGIYRTNKQIEYDKLKHITKEQNYFDCVSGAHQIYSLSWNDKCEIEGLEKDCALMKFQREDIEKDYADAQDRCVKLYK